MKKLTAKKRFKVRFSEVDSMNIVWHGSYPLYFEDAREEFGRKYGLDYMTIFSNGFTAPLVELSFKYKRPLLYEMEPEITITYIPTEAAKIVFDYLITDPRDGSEVASGHSVQVFLDKKRELVWENPEFYRRWKEKMEGEKGGLWIEKVADNIISPLGLTTAENMTAILAGKSALRRHTGLFGLPEDFCGSLLDREAIGRIFESRFGKSDDLSFFEKLCILSGASAISQAGLDPKGKDTLFVLSSTKGNVEFLENDPRDERCHIGLSALKIARFFGNENPPVTVSNACISGVAAQIAAVRQLLAGRYHTAVVIGADVLSKFIISGFQSFKALSQEECRPYDKERTGLNLGEAAATMILRATDSPAEDAWIYKSSSIRNDANHISGPSRTGEGSYRVLKDILKDVEAGELAFVSAHGTATAYNDEMESKALHRAGLDHTPVSGLKGFYGHTLGAAGVLETILAMGAVDRNAILPTRGYEDPGTSHALNISNRLRKTSKRTFIKMLSGFGGTNAGIAYRKGGEI